MIESLKSRVVPGQFGRNQQNGNVSCHFERANCLPCSYVHLQFFPGLEAHLSKCTLHMYEVHDRGLRGDYKVIRSS